MGLDMYLRRNLEVRGLDKALMANPAVINPTGNKGQLKARQDVLTRLLQNTNDPVTTHYDGVISTMFMYWRKASMIHNWFVEELADSDDNCQPIAVTVKDLQQLDKKLVAVLAKAKKDPKHPLALLDILNTRQGFFFGDYDLENPGDLYFYLKEIRATHTHLREEFELVERLKRFCPNVYVTYTYRASW